MGCATLVCGSREESLCETREREREIAGDAFVGRSFEYHIYMRVNIFDLEIKFRALFS